VIYKITAQIPLTPLYENGGEELVRQPPQDGYWPKMETRLKFAMSFPRKRESSILEVFWTPAFAGVTIKMRLHLTL
jgi:hypothetical protein